MRDETELRRRHHPYRGPEEFPEPVREDEIVISIDELLRMLWRRAWIIALVAGLLTAAAAGFSMLRTPIYEASIQILVGQREGTAAPTSLGSDVQGLMQLTRTMAEVLETRTVANAVIREMNLSEDPETFLENMTVEPVTDTQVIEVSYRDPDPERAQQVANTIGRVFSAQVSELSPSANAVTATVWERAQLPDEPVSPRPLRNAAIALVLGLMLGTGIAFLVEQLDDRWRSPEDAERVSGVPTFGVIRQFDTGAGKRKGKLIRRRGGRKEDMLDLAGRLVTLVDQDGLAAEDYRSLRTNLFYAFVDAPPKAIVTTSPGPQEGKSTTCANLGVALAQAGRSTLILDCDLRKPVIHEIFGLRNLRGVVDVLAGSRELREVWHSPVPNLRVVPVGPIPPNPAELLSSHRFRKMLEEAREQFDYVLMDAPPVGAVSDPVILSTHGDGVLLVVDAQSTRKGAVRRAMRSLEAVGARVMGTVLNNASETEGGYYYYYRRYGY